MRMRLLPFAVLLLSALPPPSAAQSPVGLPGRFTGLHGLTAGGRWIRTCMGLFLSSRFLGCCRFFVRSGKAVLRPVACDQVRGARGRGQGTETVAELGGLPPSRACVSQRLDA